MPTAHLRVCEHPCNRIRFAPCSKSCALPIDTDPANWRVNLQDGAGTIGRPGRAMVIIPPNPNAEPGEWDPFDGRAEAEGFVQIGAVTE